MAKPELGTKRLCGACGAKFYDLNKDPIVCPKCETVFEVAPVPRSRAEAQRAAVKEPAEIETPETHEAEFVSLEEADAEASGSKLPAMEGETEDVEVDDESLDDAAFLEPTEDEDEDVSNIIGSDIEDEEES